jgi:hypothetical protein
VRRARENVLRPTRRRVSQLTARLPKRLANGKTIRRQSLESGWANDQDAHDALRMRRWPLFSNAVRNPSSLQSPCRSGLGLDGPRWITSGLTTIRLELWFVTYQNPVSKECESEALDRNTGFGIMEWESNLQPRGSEPCMFGVLSLNVAAVQDV